MAATFAADPLVSTHSAAICPLECGCAIRALRVCILFSCLEEIETGVEEEEAGRGGLPPSIDTGFNEGG